MRRADELARAGVRRIFAIQVVERADGRVLAGPVSEWRDGQWEPLAPTDVIEDECLIEGLPVRALTDAVEADKAVAQALIERANPVLVEYAADSYRQGQADMLRRSIVELCGAFDIAVSTERQARIASLALEPLFQLQTAIATERRWPG